MLEYDLKSADLDNDGCITLYDLNRYMSLLGDVLKDIGKYILSKLELYPILFHIRNKIMVFPDSVRFALPSRGLFFALLREGGAKRLGGEGEIIEDKLHLDIQALLLWYLSAYLTIFSIT